jgi:hypothetical protein
MGRKTRQRPLIFQRRQVFITPGVVLGRIRLYGRLTLTVGTDHGTLRLRE